MHPRSRGSYGSSGSIARATARASQRRHEGRGSWPDALVTADLSRYQEYWGVSRLIAFDGKRSTSDGERVMPNLSISIPHQFDRAGARKRTQECIDQLR